MTCLKNDDPKVSSVSDPDPYWIQIQGCFGSGFQIRIRIQVFKNDDYDDYDYDDYDYDDYNFDYDYDYDYG